MEANESTKQNTDNRIDNCVFQFPVQALQQDYDYQGDSILILITTWVSLLNHQNTRYADSDSSSCVFFLMIIVLLGMLEQGTREH